MPYKTCPYCGANLDPGESCDCQYIEEGIALLKEELTINMKKKMEERTDDDQRDI